MPMPTPYDRAPRIDPADVGRPGHESGTSPVDVRTLVCGGTYELEIGPGRGGFLFERAAVAPEAGIVGLEIRRKWASIVDGRLVRAGLSSRVRVFAEDAKLALPRLVPEGVFDRAFLHFPDPWWKKRHAKRLVVGDVLLAELARLLAPGGELFVQTDVEERAALYERQILSTASFVAAGDVLGSARMAENPYGARSPRERRAIADGLPVHRLRFRRAA
jgi:tRNA (guanine-N7-)-methyltransferase